MTAWESVQITGAPTLLPLLDVVLDHMLMDKASSSIRLEGPLAEKMKTELIDSLGTIATYATHKPEFLSAAASLLNTLQTPEIDQS